MADIAGWIALVATTVAAMMTAANLGARVTGWGFAVFLVGSIAWIVVAATTAQTQLLYSNLFLSVVNLAGVWRWLGRRAKYDDLGEAAEQASERKLAAPNLFRASALDGMAVTDRGGRTIASVVDAMTACEDGRVAYLIVRKGGVAGVGETMHRLDWRSARVANDRIETDLDEAAFERLPMAEGA